jgi:hypothetical protein
MKKINLVFGLFFSLCLFECCLFGSAYGNNGSDNQYNFNKIKVGDSVVKAKKRYNHIYVDLISIAIFKDGENSVVAISDNYGDVSGIAVFSPSKELLFSDGIVLIDDKEIKNLSSGDFIKNIERRYGKAPCDIGSGFSIPAYITKNANIISFIKRDVYVEGQSLNKRDIIEMIRERYKSVDEK